MKTKKAIEAFQKMLHMENDEHKSYKPIISKLKGCHVEFNNSLTDDALDATEWINGEGFDFNFYNKNGDTILIPLHIDNIELMLLALHKLNYFGKNEDLPLMVDRNF